MSMNTEGNIGEKREITVSVLCATYNHEKYIARALEGFISQVTDFRFEVIVHEDASTDGTRGIVEKYESEYPDLIKPIYQEKNQYSQGRGIVLSNMLSAAKGRYIALCEGDDYWIDEHKLQKQYEALEAHKECSICIHKVKHIRDNVVLDPEKLKQTQNKYHLKGGVIEKEKMANALWLEGGYPAQTSCYFMRRSVIEVRQKNKEPFLKCMLGDQINLRLSLMHGKFYFIDEIMSHRIKGTGGSWNDRWTSFSGKERAKYYTMFMKGEMLYDEYSGYEFHEYIQVHLANLLLECCIYDPDSVKEWKRNIRFKFSTARNKARVGLYIRYHCMCLAPGLYKRIFEIKKSKR